MQRLQWHVLQLIATIRYEILVWWFQKFSVCVGSQLLLSIIKNTICELLQTDKIYWKSFDTLHIFIIIWLLHILLSQKYQFHSGEWRKMVQMIDTDQ